MEKRFKALRTIGSIYKVVGIIVAVLTVLGALAACAALALGSSAMSEFSSGSFVGGAFGGALAAIGIILYGGFIALTAYGAGEAIYLLVDMEENTRASADAARATAALLQRLSLPQPPAPQP